MKVMKRSSPLLKTKPYRSDFFHVVQTTAARYLLEPQNQAMLKPFMQHEISVTQAAELLNLDFRKTYSLVKRLEGYGFIHVTRLEKRDGRPICYYQATAENFFIPASLVPLEQVMQIINNGFERAFAEHFVRATWGEVDTGSGIQLWADQQGTMNCLLVKRPDIFMMPIQREFAATYGMWHSWSLDFEDAKALQKELFELSERYSRRPKGSQTYLVRLAMTPL